MVSNLKLKDKTALIFTEGIVDTIYEPLIVLESDLRVVSANKSFYKFFKVNPSETIDNLIYNLGNGQWDIPELRLLLEDILPQSSIINDFEVNHNFEDIGHKSLLLNARRMDIEDIQPLILISIFDITERKKAEEHKQYLLENEQKLTDGLQTANEELRIISEEFLNSNEELKNAQERLNETIKKLEISNQELEQFAYVASHDLQEPLRMVASFTQLLKMKYKDKLGEDADEYIDFIVEGAHRMKTLIDDLLAFSRLNTQTEEFKYFDWEKNLNEVISNLKTSIEDNQAIITHDPLPNLRADPSQIKQLFQNLISNAIKFRTDDAPKIHISVEELENEYRFGVHDNGIGIDPDNQKKIFDIFKRLHTREEYVGTGIGLAICKRIVERHSGQIWVESPGNGSTFYFTIPK